MVNIHETRVSLPKAWLRLNGIVPNGGGEGKAILGKVKKLFAIQGNRVHFLPPSVGGA
jgi:hypothetical protein